MDGTGGSVETYESRPEVGISPPRSCPGEVNGLSEKEVERVKIF